MPLPQPKLTEHHNALFAPTLQTLTVSADLSRVTIKLPDGSLHVCSDTFAELVYQPTFRKLMSGPGMKMEDANRAAFGTIARGRPAVPIGSFPASLSARMVMRPRGSAVWAGAGVLADIIESLGDAQFAQMERDKLSETLKADAEIAEQLLAISNAALAKAIATADGFKLGRGKNSRKRTNEKRFRVHGYTRAVK